MSNLLSIGFVEQFLGDEKSGDGFYHSFVALIPRPDTKDGFWQKAQKIHFDDDKNFPRFRPNATVEYMSENCHVDVYTGGREEIILPRWNHILVQAVQIREKEFIPFDAVRANCRSGAKAAIEAIGLDFRNEFAKCTAGIGTNGFSPLVPFEHEENNSAHTSLNVMRELNQNLIMRLNK